MKEGAGGIEQLREVLRVSVGDGVDFAIYSGKDGQLFVNFEKRGKIVISPVELIEDDKRSRTVVIRDEEYFVSNPESWYVKIPTEELRDPRNIFTLLHELGHLQIWSPWKEKNLEDVDRLMEYKAVPSELSDEDVHKGVLLELQNERDAWAAGLRMARKLREKHGIDLFKLFKNVDELMGWLRVDQLETYENELRVRGGKVKNEQTDKVHSWLQTRWEEDVLRGLDREVPEDLT